jgi:hypothetical protein
MTKGEEVFQYFLDKPELQLDLWVVLEKVVVMSGTVSVTDDDMSDFLQQVGSMLTTTDPYRRNLLGKFPTQT